MACLDTRTQRPRGAFNHQSPPSFHERDNVFPLFDLTRPVNEDITCAKGVLNEPIAKHACSEGDQTPVLTAQHSRMKAPICNLCFLDVYNPLS